MSLRQKLALGFGGMLVIIAVDRRPQHLADHGTWGNRST